MGDGAGAGGRRLIVNADDLGLSRAVNRGIVELHAAGIVTSASLMMNLPATEDALARTADGDLDVGVHLNLTVGRPMAGSAPGLVDSDGRMGPPARVLQRLAAGSLRLATVEREWSAQIEAYLATGRRPAHLDSHVHLHALPGLYGLSWRLAERYGIGAVRQRGQWSMVHQAVPLLPAWLAQLWRPGPPPSRRASGPLTSDWLLVLTVLGGRATTSVFEGVLRGLAPGVTELVTHAGYVDDELRSLDLLREPRERELALLLERPWATLLAEAGGELTSFRREVERAAEARA